MVWGSTRNIYPILLKISQLLPQNISVIQTTFHIIGLQTIEIKPHIQEMMKNLKIAIRTLLHLLEVVEEDVLLCDGAAGPWCAHLLRESGEGLADRHTCKQKQYSVGIHLTNWQQCINPCILLLVPQIADVKTDTIPCLFEGVVTVVP